MQFRINFIKGWLIYCSPGSSCVGWGTLKAESESVHDLVRVYVLCQNIDYLPVKVKSVNIKIVTKKAMNTL